MITALLYKYNPFISLFTTLFYKYTVAQHALHPHRPDVGSPVHVPAPGHEAVKRCFERAQGTVQEIDHWLGRDQYARGG